MNVWEEVYLKNKCSLCGACVYICNKRALEISNNELKLNKDKCINCSLCLKVCPHYTVTLEELKPIAMYYARSLDKTILKYAHSGGVVTSLFSFLINEGIISKALIVLSEGLRPIPKLTNDYKELILSAGSKYSFCPLLTLLSEVEKERSVGIVGLPCHFEALNKILRFRPKLTSKIYIRIGLLCQGNFNFLSLTKLLNDEFGLVERDVNKIMIKKGRMIILTSSGEIKRVSIQKIQRYMASACKTCPYFIPKADIAVGNLGAPEGFSLVIILTEKGKELFERAIENKVLEARKADEKVLRVISKIIKRKRRYLNEGSKT